MRAQNETGLDDLVHTQLCVSAEPERTALGGQNALAPWLTSCVISGKSLYLLYLSFFTCKMG